MTAKKFDRVFDSLEDFVDTISDVLACPVTLEDANHQLLAYSSHDDETDAARISTIIGRRVPEKLVNRFWKEGVIPALNQSDDPIEIHSIIDMGLRNRVAISIRKKKEVLGYIWVIEVDTKLSNQQKQLLKLAATKAKNLLLQFNLQKKRREKNHQELLWQIITGDTHSHDGTALLLDKVGVVSPKPLAFMLISFQKMSDVLYRNVMYIVKTTSKISMLIETIDDNQLICLISPTNEATSSQTDLVHFMETIQLQMSERFGIDNMNIGCGYLYHDYSKLTQSYHEAVKVVQIKANRGKELRSAYFYHELGVFRHLDLLQQYENEIVFNPALDHIQMYDQQNATSLYETLEIFLQKDGNMNETAKDLHIHVNTLSYRLRRIQEIANVELKDPIQRIGLFLDIKLKSHLSIN
ncbi:helix-turn-helix domain-containing protein [Alkalihalobacillus sp. MEB130]|uniref:PucR family transcriptional regulator n=1 Tax=Alkalihalobacillus sp. MEB130 TaxID=2976704 RepID=UPI0028DF2AE3|nr:helix-turn-helix domain-containing protein [Alkalihalobacillus sp. MEB130]MDT8862474.1 helix-turn-helix domain-containing protein [Alkalihalobacillus sp. MEB130]